MRLIDADMISYTHSVARSLDDGHNWDELCVTKDEIDDMPTVTPDSDDGWVLCSERMPEEEESIFAKYYGTDKWHRGMFRKRSERVDVTVVRSDGMREVTSAKTFDGEWRLDTNFYLHQPKVIAWKPKVEPYMGDVKDGD